MPRRSRKSSPLGALVLFTLVGSIFLYTTIHPAVGIIPIVILVLVLYLRHREQKRRKIAMLYAGNIDSMSGTEFEELLEAVFIKLGYTTRHMGKSGDFGVDLIIHKNKETIAIQAKRYKSIVSNSAVQEVYAGMAKHNCKKGWVITNSYFTKAAIEQAKACNIKLIEREELLDMISNARTSDINNR